MVMIRVNINEVKVHLSKYLRLVDSGEVVHICKRNIPVAELVTLEKPGPANRKIGLAKGEFVVPDDIDRPLEREITDLFHENYT